MHIDIDIYMTLMSFYDDGLLLFKDDTRIDVNIEDGITIELIDEVEHD